MHQIEISTQLFDAAEAAATLALRDGKPEALGFYRLDPSTPDFPTAPTRPTCSHSQVRQRSAKRWQPTARRTAHRRAAENLPSTDPVLEAARVVAARPSPTGTSAAISSRLGVQTVQVCRALYTLANE